MDTGEARAHLNYLLTLGLRREEAFGPMALNFIKEDAFEKSGLLPEEQFSLIMATVQALAEEPKRYNMKLEMLKRAVGLLEKTSFNDPQLARQLDQDVKKTEAELGIYNEAMRPTKSGAQDKQKLIVQCDAPEYFLDIAQKRATAYYQNKFGLSKESKTTNAFHLMMPFDLKISRTPEDPLDAGMRAYYAKMGYSFPLGFEMGKICSYQDGEILDIPLDDPNLLFLSVSKIKEKEFRAADYPGTPEVPFEYAYPRAVLERTGTLGPYVQLVANFKIWFDASQLSILIQGAPDLYEYGLQGGSGMMVRSHASDKVPLQIRYLSLKLNGYLQN